MSINIYTFLEVLLIFLWLELKFCHIFYDWNHKMTAITGNFQSYKYKNQFYLDISLKSPQFRQAVRYIQILDLFYTLLVFILISFALYLFAKLSLYPYSRYSSSCSYLYDSYFISSIFCIRILW